MPPLLSCSPFDLSFPFFRRCGTRRFATQTVLALDRKNTQENYISMGSHGSKGGFLNHVGVFKELKRTVLKASYPVDDRLTTGRNMLLQFRHSRHPWRSDVVSRACIWVRQAFTKHSFVRRRTTPIYDGWLDRTFFGVSTKR